jgi:hypothetical protein
MDDGNDEAEDDDDVGSEIDGISCDAAVAAVIVGDTGA